jgi:exopolysaccharide biosynthesis WecB/TagA/CpsF family protein
MPFDLADPAAVFDTLARRPPERPFAYVVTPNVDHVVRLQADVSNLSPLYSDAWMTVCDSRVLAALSFMAGSRLPVTTGSDLTEALLRRAIGPSDPINIVGGDADVVRRLRERFGLSRIRHYTPPPRLNEQPREIGKCIEFIETHPARFTFLAVGSPQQEKIARGAWARGKATGVGLCIGTALLFSTGVAQRAPRWVQRLGLEWLHRLIHEPSRLARRYLVDDMRIFPAFSQHLLTAHASGRRQPHAQFEKPFSRSSHRQR